MSTAYILTETHFDNMENSSSGAQRKEILGVFIDDNPATETGKSPLQKIDELLKNRPSQKHYTGWDNNIYPKFEIIATNLF